MKRVSVISDCVVVATGENDGRILDSFYTKVNGEYYFATSLIREEDGELVTKLLLEQQVIIKQAKDRQFEIQTVFNNILRSGLESEEYPDIRNKEWFKAIKPTK